MQEPPATIRIHARDYLTIEATEDVDRREVLDNMQAELFHIGVKRLSIRACPDRLSESRDPIAHSVCKRLDLRRQDFGKRINIVEHNLGRGQRPDVA